MQSSSERSTKLDMFRAVDASMREKKERLQCRFNKAAAHINDLFITMGNYDVRFHFDPVSLDDCRCEIVSPKEVSLLCTLKELPAEDFMLDGKVKSGGMYLEFDASYTASPDKASWEDVISESETGRCFLSTEKVIQVLRTVIQQSIQEISQENNQQDMVPYFRDGNLSVIVRLGDPTFRSDAFRVNLLPTVQVKRFVKPLPKLDKRLERVFKALCLKDTNVESICLVGRPNSKDQKLIWRVTFNDIEARIFNLSNFQCAKQCLFILNKLCDKYAQFRRTGGELLPYHLQAILLHEFLEHPHPKAWTPEKFDSRLNNTLGWFCRCLCKKKCNNIFSGVNLFQNLGDERSKFLARKLAKFKLDPYHLAEFL